MTGFSNLVLLWLFGKWIFDKNQLSSNAVGLDVTPLTIFAAQFSTVGLAMFSLLGMWAIFLGIFRLRNNGNFFGARDGNESFFYPFRLMVAIALTAPVIPVGSAGTDNITLTAAHSFVAGIAKTASEFGDSVQSSSFELMHKYNLFHDPEFKVSVNADSAKKMIDSWKISAIHLANAFFFKNPYDRYNGNINGLAQDALIMKWEQNHGSIGGYSGSVEDRAWLFPLTASLPIPEIPPNDAIAKDVVTSLVKSDASDGTVKNELSNEGWICKTGWMQSTFCSSEYLKVKNNNAASINVGVSSAQRQIWNNLFSYATAQAAVIRNDLPSSDSKKILDDTIKWTNQTATWYAEIVSSTISNQLAADQAARAEVYFQEVKHWGWMLGGTFVLRAASDFSRASSYAEMATSTMMPASNLSTLTAGDDLSKIVESKAIATIREGGATDESWLTSIFSLDFLKTSAGPNNQNIHNIASWGRAMVGSGIGLVAGGSIVKYVPGLKELSDGSLIKTVGWLLIGGGGMLGYVMPMLFAIYGLMGAMSWLVAVASTFFGVSLWAAGMAAPKGEEHTSQLSAKGWNTFIFIGLYPALSVGGLAAAIVISSVGLSLVQMVGLGIWGMFDPGGSAAGKPLETLGGVLVGGVLTVGIIVLLSWNVVTVSAQLVTSFPRAVLNLISLSEPGLNPYENSMHGLVGNVSQLARNAISGHIQRSVFTRNPSQRSTPNSASGDQQ